MTAAPPPLTLDAIHSAIDGVCLRHEHPTWSFRRKADKDLTAHDANVDEDNLLFGVESSVKDGANKSNAATTTFYFAYSTWDGRYLYLDQLGTTNRGTTVGEHSDE